jgi:hypothetical protein
VLEQNARTSDNPRAPKLSARAAGIESVIIPKGSPWDDFERVFPHPKEKERAGSRTAGLLVLFFALQRKEHVLNNS